MDDAYTTAAGDNNTFHVLNNDLLQFGPPLDQSTLAILTLPEHDVDTEFRVHDNHVHYKTQAGYSGIDSFTYQVCNFSGFCDSAVVVIAVDVPLPPPTPVPPPGCPTTSGCPNAQDDAYTTAAGDKDTFHVLDNDLRQFGGPLDMSTLAILTFPQHDVDTEFSVDGNHVHYEAQTGYSGADSFTYEVCNLVGFCDTATVVITITP